MGLISLGIRNVRNLAGVDLAPNADLNLLFGTNGSGKTSVLEALYMLGHGRSFRTHRFEKLVRSGEQLLQVVGQIQRGQHKLTVGFERNRGTTRIRVGGKDAMGAAMLASTLPMQLIHPNSHQLLEEGPGYRRRFLDWGVFHVEPGFFPVWQRYQRALRQRNAALRARHASRLACAWDQELSETATRIDAFRRAYVTALQPVLTTYASELADLGDLDCSYRRGWSADRELSEVLEEQWAQDLERGYTAAGPQRAELRFRVGGVDATGRVSRGQQKLVVSALLLAQAALFTERTRRECLLLVDDVAAELDVEHRSRLLAVVGGLKAQAFVTAIEPESVLELYGGSASVFHVEHGQVREVV
jgi:DNA replication and repair protein RecF